MRKAVITVIPKLCFHRFLIHIKVEEKNLLEAGVVLIQTLIRSPEQILNGEKWHYLAAKKLSALSRGITSKHYSDFYCLNCLHFFRTKNKFESHKKYVKIKIFVM